ncbi:MAG TPA: hypothetical protein DCE44_22850 [Verrucomicrobiales bacterium]|nr:hypothetical protein [Verrucomicrobiales bacterium]
MWRSRGGEIQRESQFMRQCRLKAPPSFPVASCHCWSRVVDRQFCFGELEREKSVRRNLRGPRRRDGARPLAGLKSPLCTLRELPARVIG